MDGMNYYSIVVDLVNKDREIRYCTVHSRAHSLFLTIEY